MKRRPADATFSRLGPTVLSSALAAALVLADAAVVAAAGGKGVTLRYGLKPSSTDDQVPSIVLDLKLDPATLPETLAPLVQSLAGEMRQEMTLKGRIDVKPQAKDGTTPFTFSIVE